MFPRATTPLFAYGNLRPGMPLWSRVAPHVEAVHPATLRGRLYWHETGTYPVLVTDARAGVVQGEILELPPHPDVSSLLVGEELLFGYDARWAQATLSATGRPRDVLVMVWARRDGLGPMIASGDYLDEEARPPA